MDELIVYWDDITGFGESLINIFLLLLCNNIMIMIYGCIHNAEHVCKK